MTGYITLYEEVILRRLTDKGRDQIGSIDGTDVEVIS